jgi:hypothetical protein
LQKLFKLLRIPTDYMPEMRFSKNTRGKYCLWATKLMAVAYSVQFKLPYFLMLEDDVIWSNQMRKRLKEALPLADSLDKDARAADPDSPREQRVGGLLKISRWGEGYFFTQYAARNFISEVYNISINHHSDVWIRDYLKPKMHGIPYTLAVLPNKGNVYTTPHVHNRKEFAYSKVRGGQLPLLTLLEQGKVFTSRGDLNLTAVVHRLVKDVVL